MEPKGHRGRGDLDTGEKLSRLKLVDKPMRVNGRLEAKQHPLDDEDSDTDQRRGATHMRDEECSDEGDTASCAERKRDLDVEREWKQLQSDTSGGQLLMPTSPRAKKIAKGLIINHMNMRCGDTGKLMWQSDEWRDDVYLVEQHARVPAAILKCSAVSREINFSSAEEISQFRLEQRIFLDSSCIEEWIFEFGYVIPHSTNSWQQTIESAGADNMLDPALISGKLTIETGFYDGQTAIAKTVYRIYYA